MTKNDIKQILIDRDGLSAKEANALIAEAQEAFDQYLEEQDLESAENICQEYFNLEIDYLTAFTQLHIW